MPVQAAPDAEVAAWVDRIREAADPAAAAGLAREALAAPRVEAPALLQALKDASKAMLTADPVRALVLAEALLAGAEAAALPWFGALGRMARGDALSAQGGRVADALDELDAAGAAFRSLGDEVAWSRTRIGWIYLRTLSGRATEADFLAAEQARQVLADAGEGALAVTLDRNLMLCHWQRGRLDRAEACFDRAMAAAGPWGRPGPLEEAGLRANRGLILTSQARLDEALEEHRLARDLYEGLRQRESLRRQEHNLGHLYLAMSDESRALQHFYRALALMEEGRALPRGLLLANIARCHLALGRRSEGLAEAREALAVLRAQGAGAEALRCSQTLAGALAASPAAADRAEAEQLLEACLADPRLAGLQALDGSVRLDLAELALGRGDAAAAARWSAQARERFRAGRLVLLELLSDLVAAEADLVAGRPAAAAAGAERLRAEARARGLEALLPRAWHLTARVAEADGRPAPAREAYQAAVDALDRRLGRLPPHLRTYVMDERLGLMADAVRCYRRSAGVDDLWWMLERTKAQADLHRLAGEGPAAAPAGEGGLARSPGGGGDLAERLRRAERRQADLFGWRHAPDWLPELPGAARPGVDDLARLDERLAAAEAEVLRLREQLALAGWEPDRGDPAPPGREQWSPPQPPSGTVLAAFALAGAKAFVLLAGEGRRAVVDLPAGADGLLALVEAWREAVEDAAAASAAGLPASALLAPLRERLSRLYQALVRPWQDWLDGASRLLLLPQGALHGLPFGAFHDGRRYLLEGLELGAAPSLAWWDACRHRGPARPRGLVAAFGHGGALSGATEEAVKVAGILGLPPLLEAAATRDAVLAGAQGAGLLHLAGHAASRPEQPDFAHLWLADGASLSGHDLAALDLRGALVTLSGCETSLGRLTGADEVLSLGRACLRAGAATVLGTLWPLRDAAAAAMLPAVYRELSQGRPVGAALRQAQLAALAGEWPSPLDWAAFQCLGSCDTMLPDAFNQEVPA